MQNTKDDLFETVVKAIRRHQKQLVFDASVTSTDIEPVLQKVWAEGIALFWYAGDYTWVEDTHTLQLRYLYNLRQSKELSLQIDEALAELDFDFSTLQRKDDFEVAMTIYKWFSDHFDPLCAETETDTDTPFSLVDFAHRRAFRLCDVAYVAQYLFAQKGITAIVVSGQLRECHQRCYWNIVCLQGHYYHFDAAKSCVYWPAPWGIPARGDEFVIDTYCYDFFCIDDQKIEQFYDQITPHPLYPCSDALTARTIARLDEKVQILMRASRVNEPKIDFSCDSCLAEERPMALKEGAPSCRPQKKRLFSSLRHFDLDPTPLCTYEPSPDLNIPDDEVAPTLSYGLPDALSGNPFSRLFRRKKSHTVYSSVYAPAEVRPGHTFLVDIFLHQAKDAVKVAAMAKESQFDAERRYYSPLSTKVKVGEKISLHFSLYYKGQLLKQDSCTSIWNGGISRCTFDYYLDKSYKDGELYAKGYLVVNGSIIGNISFLMQIKSNPAQIHAQVDSRKYERVFISYSVKDVEKVKLIAAGFKSAGNLHFFDQISLSAGDVYFEKIFDYIDTADLFLLCWSQHAAESVNVERERKYALQHAYPQVPHEQATLDICTLNLPPYADFPEDMREIYHFETIE